MTGAEIVVISFLTGCSVCVAFFGMCALRPSDRRLAQVASDEADPLCAYQFHNTALIDATEAATLLAQSLGAKAPVTSFADLTRILRKRFPAFPGAPPDDVVHLRSGDPDDHGVARIEPKGPYTRVTIDDRAFSAADLQLLRQAQLELAILRRAATDAPDPIWEEHHENGVTWANSAYYTLKARARQVVPDEPLFHLPLPVDGKSQVRRARVELPDRETPEWYEITSRPSGDAWMRYASNIDAVVNAETTQRNFVQTLAKTFAHLPTGLAIFDRHRSLALFNPAIVDLTGLSAEFLGSRPNVMSFFDHLREAQIMPEPKDYKNWRERLAELVAAASDDRYCETWSLPSGLTYRVTGRPHPDGAIAFLFEDISAEVSLTRRFRAEMEVSQAVLDNFDEAVAVFSQLGVLTMTNAAYRRLWASNPDSSFSELTIVDATRLWQKMCEPNSAWHELRDYVTVTPERAPWEFDLVKRSGETLYCQIDPISSGSTLVRFRTVSGVPAKPAATSRQTVA